VQFEYEEKHGLVTKLLCVACEALRSCGPVHRQPSTSHLLTQGAWTQYQYLRYVVIITCLCRFAEPEHEISPAPNSATTEVCLPCKRQTVIIGDRYNSIDITTSLDRFIEISVSKQRNKSIKTSRAPLLLCGRWLVNKHLTRLLSAPFLLPMYRISQFLVILVLACLAVTCSSAQQQQAAVPLTSPPAFPQQFSTQVYVENANRKYRFDLYFDYTYNRYLMDSYGVPFFLSSMPAKSACLGSIVI
jgi:hypothetical protein